MKILINIAGWYGAIATLGAFILVSYGYLSPHDYFYQLLNLSGAIGLGILCYSKRAYQPLFVNIIWAAIALSVIIHLIFFG